MNILDLVLVVSESGNAAGFADYAVSRPGEGFSIALAIHPRSITPTRVDVKRWLAQARSLDPADAQSQKGIVFLERLLAALTPKETVLLPNFPNPFNPETWIPYQLAHDAEVRIPIYDMKGALMLLLDIGCQQTGFYTDKGSAAYWDGKNDFGETVASGVYFYTLTAGGFSATRKMLIQTINSRGGRQRLLGGRTPPLRKQRYEESS